MIYDDSILSEESEQDQIVTLVKKVALHPKAGWERSTICATDCLEQWKRGWLKDTILAWERYLLELDTNEGHVSEHRHGAWVPAIPL